MLGPDNPSDEFPTFNGWKPDVRRSEIGTFTDESGRLILGEHDHRPLRPGESGDPDKTRFPVGFDTGEQVRDWVTEIIDYPAFGKQDPDDPGVFYLFGTYQGIEGIVVVRTRWGTTEVVTGFPLPRVKWDTWKG